MNLSALDIAILLCYFALIIGVGLLFARRAKQSMLDYFISGRSMPWWIAGLAMVATTFSADTPLAVTEMVTRSGVSGNWLWWSMLPTGMLTVFFFSKLWRRAEVVTDVEVTEMRYSGRPAAFLRGFRAGYLGLLINIIIMGWVNLGMAKVLEGVFGFDKWTALLVCLAIAFLYAIVSGYWGVASTGGLQYIFGMGGAILLAVVAVRAVGGIDAMKAGVALAHPAGHPEVVFGSADAVLSFWPTGEAVWVMPTITLATLLMMNWWASWYPGAEPGGGGYVAQNMLACRTERDARLAVLLFNVLHYAVRTWPWVITALCALAIYGGPVRNAAGLEDPGGNYVQLMVDYLPSGLRGLMLASFAAAYMSTQATQMNWGSSYLVNDLYRRFLRKGAPEKHYVLASRIATVVTLILSLIATLFMSQISRVWELLLTLGAGTGLVYILRWYWWRINAWSEVAAMASAFIVSISLRLLAAGHPVLDASRPRGFALNLILTTTITTVVWLVVTFATRPESHATLEAFYRKVRPAGPGWKPFALSTGLAPARGQFARNSAFWILGIALVWSSMFAVGALVLDQPEKLAWFAAVAVISGFLLFRGLAREPDEEGATPLEPARPGAGT
ncbi:MAG TPA: sodium:solute symporter family protein [Thermoanaerobaculia bacterium]|nr:sodium:solute symporter family protein [Thermoanaerobaculia bacterium]